MAWTVDGLEYTTRKKITIDNTKIDSDLTDFPVLVKLTSTNFDFSKANSDGFDIRFTSSDGSTLLKYERERHDSANSLAEYWVKIPSVSSSADTEFYIYYRTTDTADGADPTNVWDANFKEVWHLKDLTTSTVEDSTSNNKDGTKVAANEPIEADAKIAKGQDFDGVNDVITLTEDTNLGSDFTLEAWVKIDSLDVGVGRRLLESNVASYSNYWALMGIKNPSGVGRQAYVNLYDGDNNPYAATPGDSITTGAWHYLVFVRDTTNDIIKIFLDVTTTAQTEDTTTTTPGYSEFRIGAGGWGGNLEEFMDGLMDEVRISNVVRSAAWIKASYNSGNDSLVSYGSEETAYTQSCTDVVALAEAVTKSQGMFLTISDVMSLSETTSKLSNYKKILSDILPLTDVVAKIQGLYKTLVEQLSLTDIASILTKFKKTITENIVLVGQVIASILQNIQLTLTEAISLNDVVSRIQKFYKTLSDVIGLTDVISGIQRLKTTLTEQIFLNEILSKIVGFKRVLIESVSLNDVVSKIQGFKQTIVDAISLQGVVSKLTKFKKTLTETIPLVDTISKIQTFFLSLTDSIGLTDALSKLTKFVKTITDRITLRGIISIPGTWWREATKHLASWTQGTKHTASWTNKNKHTSSWTHQSKH